MKYSKLLLLLPLTATAAEQTIPPASTIRQMIGREKVVAFSKDYLIKSGLDETDLKKFENIIKTSLGYVVPSKKEALLTNADRLFYTLDNANAFVKEAVKKLHDTYGTHYIKKQDKYFPQLDLSTTPSSALSELTALHNQAKSLREKVLEVANTAFPRDYIEKLPTPDSWATTYLKNSDGSLKSPTDLFPKYSQFVKDFATSGDYATFKKNYGQSEHPRQRRWLDGLGRLKDGNLLLTYFSTKIFHIRQLLLAREYI